MGSSALTISILLAAVASLPTAFAGFSARCRKEFRQRERHPDPVCALSVQLRRVCAAHKVAMAWSQVDRFRQHAVPDVAIQFMFRNQINFTIHKVG